MEAVVEQAELEVNRISIDSVQDATKQGISRSEGRTYRRYRNHGTLHIATADFPEVISRNGVCKRTCLAPRYYRI